jgi:hypothetical protein
MQRTADPRARGFRVGWGGGRDGILIRRGRVEDDFDDCADAADAAADDDDDNDDDNSNRSMNSGSGGNVLLHSLCRLQATLCVTCDVRRVTCDV